VLQAVASYTADDYSARRRYCTGVRPACSRSASARKRKAGSARDLCAHAACKSAQCATAAGVRAGQGRGGGRAPSAPGAANSCTSSSATSLYVVRPLPSTFWHTFMLKWRRPLPPCRPPPLPQAPPLSPAPPPPPRDVPLCPQPAGQVQRRAKAGPAHSINDTRCALNRRQLWLQTSAAVHLLHVRCLPVHNAE